MLKEGIATIKEEEEKIEDNEDGDPIQIDTSKQEEAATQLKEFIATGSRDKKIRIFEVKSGKLVITLTGHDNWITDLLF